MSSRRSDGTTGRARIDVLGAFWDGLGDWLRPGRRKQPDLRASLQALFNGHPGREYSFQRLILLTGPESPEQLAIVLDGMAREGLISRVFRVQSRRTMAGLGDFASLLDVPSRIYDRTSDEDLEIDPHDVLPLFKTA